MVNDVLKRSAGKQFSYFNNQETGGGDEGRFQNTGISVLIYKQWDSQWICTVHSAYYLNVTLQSSLKWMCCSVINSVGFLCLAAGCHFSTSYSCKTNIDECIVRDVLGNHHCGRCSNQPSQVICLDFHQPPLFDIMVLTSRALHWQMPVITVISSLFLALVLIRKTDFRLCTLIATVYADCSQGNIKILLWFLYTTELDC